LKIYQKYIFVLGKGGSPTQITVYPPCRKQLSMLEEKTTMSKRYLAISLVTIFVLFAAACAPQVPATQAPATEAPTEPAATEAPTEAPTELPAPAEPKILRLSGGASDYGTIDPSLATQSAEIQIAETTSLGVVRQNETTAEIEPAMATGYEVSDDGLTYTVHIMQGVP
jgi:ABC-type transport system substrate-binding protein